MSSNSNNISPMVIRNAQRVLLSTPTPNMIYRIAAMPLSMPANGGTTTVARRYDPLPAALTPVSNAGIAPAPTAVNFVDISATMSFYLQYTSINEQVVLQNQEDVLNAITIRLGVSLNVMGDNKPDLNTWESLKAA